MADDVLIRPSDQTQSGNPLKLKLIDNGDGSWSLATASAGAGGSTPVKLMVADTKTGTLQNAAAATGNGTLFDVSGYAVCVFNVTGTFSGTIVFEASSDDTNWVSLNVTQIGAGVIGTTATASGLYRASVAGIKSVRARISVYTSGSITVAARATIADSAPKFINVNPYKLAGEDLVADRQLVEQRNNLTYISTATTTVVKTGAGLIHRIFVQGGTAGTIVGYDNTAASGTIIFSLDSTSAIGSYELNGVFATGLTIVTAAATKLTVAYR